MPAPISDVETASAPSTAAGDERRPDPKLAGAVDTARSAAEDEAVTGTDPTGSPVLVMEADGEAVGEHVGVEYESDHAATHYFETTYRGYVGWRWAVTVATSGPEDPVTVSEVVLLPGPEALVAPDWVPWSERIRPGDLGAGDLLPSGQDDPRLTGDTLPGDDDPVAELAYEVGGGRERVLSRQGRLEAAERWESGEFGPDSETARLAPGSCGSCGFFLPLAGSMRAAFGVCANAVSPADGRVVHVEFGCGAHSEGEVDTSSTVPVAEVVYDDTSLDFESRDAG
ncbi:DUF3027 domain-containing protein [Actinopolyspora erythraea]|uniref:DUF3027 domain-containing protein n=1 Tax=Actinopolyspora erythraea TaxID=414996 RepID=A0A099D4X4_9ACTN|nr:DUF3027 domain-containing protein [Actinopolyspora erythraea]ASU77396.1 DUF3027 domain-containing protein [Actinopolyspora erythraea]KGI80390.1 hypothetical protein IL38_18250 [Actinopolyspora erythraea]